MHYKFICLYICIMHKYCTLTENKSKDISNVY